MVPLQTSVRKTLARCHSEGMPVRETVAYILIRHCSAELPRFNTKRELTEAVEKYYEEHETDGKEDHNSRPEGVQA